MGKTEEQLRDELAKMRQRIAELESEKAGRGGTEDGVRTNEALRLFLDAIQESLIVIDGDGTVLAANGAGARRLGKSVNEIEGRCFYDHFPAGAERAQRQRFDRVFLAGETIHFEDELEGRFIETFCYPVFEGKGKVSGAVVFTHDITDRKRIEEALTREKETFHMVLENYPTGLALIDSDGIYRYVNPEFTRITGYTLEDIPSGREWFRKAYPDPVYRKAVMATWQEDMLSFTGSAVNREFSITRSDGRMLVVDIRTTFMKDLSIIVLNDVTESKRAEERLRQSEGKYRELVENANSIILRMDTVGRVTFFNEFAQRFFGYDEQEILGNNVVGTIVPRYESTGRDLEWLIEDIGRNVDLYVTNVNENMRHNGERVWIAWTNKPIYDDKGRFVEILCIGNDITQRRRVEESLRDREQILRAIIHGSPIPQFVIDNDHKVLYWNEALTKYTGIAADEMVGTSEHWRAFYTHKRPCLADFLVDGNTSLLPQWYPGKYSSSRLIEGAYEAVDHFPAFGKQAKWLHFTAATIRDLKGNVIGAVETLVDITEQKDAEAALKKSEEKYRGIFENAVEGIFQSSVEGRFLSVNPAMATMCGYSSPEEMVTLVSDIAREYYLNLEDRVAFLRVLETEGFVQGYEHRIRRKDGSTRWASVSARVVRDRNGETLYYEGTNLDITERKNLEAQLLQAQKMEAVGTLAGGVAHDFNNILMAIMGYTGLIGMKIPDDYEIRNYLNQLQECASRAANLTRGLLAFSRKQAVELQPHSTNAILRDCEKLLRRLVPEDVEFTLSLSEDSTIMADMTQIDQVLINLVSNAKDAMPKGGRLCIEAGVVDLGGDFRQTYGFGEPGRYALISVSDTGAGIDEATGKKIFEPFFTTKEVGKGTGLGLSIVYGIVKQHGGYITVSSEPERRTTFDVYLPAVKVEAFDRRRESMDMPGGTETVLLAEDDTYVREIAGEILRTSGYTVVEAVDGEEAVKKFRESPWSIDLLVLDVVMPGKNGKEAYDEIRKTSPSIPVIFMSGYTGDVVLDRGIEDSVVDYISKPLSAPELLKKVRDVLER